MRGVVGVAPLDQRREQAKETVVLLCARRLFTQGVAQELSGMERVVLIADATRLDERVAEGLADARFPSAITF